MKLWGRCAHTGDHDLTELLERQKEIEWVLLLKVLLCRIWNRRPSDFATCSDPGSVFFKVIELSYLISLILTKLCCEHDTSCATTLRNLMLLLRSYIPYIWLSVFDISLFHDRSELISLSSCQALIVGMLHMHIWNFSLFSILVNSNCGFSLCKDIEMSGSGR